MSCWRSTPGRGAGANEVVLLAHHCFCDSISVVPGTDRF